MDEPPVRIDYAMPDPPRLRLRWRHVGLWLVISAAIWWFLDHGVYVGRGPTARLKFTLPLWFQLVESAILGAIVVGASVIVGWALRHWARR